MSDSREEVVRCTRIEVVDAAGVVRAVIGTADNDRADSHPAFVTLFGPDGSERVSLSCEDDSAGIELVYGGSAVASLSFGHGHGAKLTFPDAA
jgi:hypothetical protein